MQMFRHGNVCDAIASMARRHGPVFSIPAPGRPYVVIGHAEEFEQVLVRSRGFFTKSFTLEPLELMCSKELLYPDEAERRRLGGIFRPLLSRAPIVARGGGFGTAIEAACSTTPARFVDGHPRPVIDLLLDLHYRVLLNFYLGADIAADPRHMGQRSLELTGLLPRVWPTRIVPTPWRSRARTAISELRAHVRDLIESQPADTDAVLNCRELRQRLTEEQLRENVLILLYSSINVPVLLESCLHELLSNPEELRRIEQSTGEARRQALQLALQETLRLHPVSSLILRDTTLDCEIAGYHIAQGSVVVLPTILVNRDPAIWPDPMRFDPLRFATEAARPDIFAYGRGPRFCIGKSFAEAVMAPLLDHVLRHFRFEQPELDGRVCQSLPYRLQGPIARLKPRNSP
ncbi:MAG: cytochrome P450 [Myxococcota bacterium]